MKKQQILVLIISILASFVAFLDGSVVNIALPAIMREMGGGLQVQQWVVDAYLITLGSLILLAGSFSDLFGRQRVLVSGLIGFGVASLLCAFAPNSDFLIGARALQGIAGALLVPSSLALIIATFSGSAQAKAIGTWTAWTGISFIIGPLLGGFLVDTWSWRLVFGINVVPIVVTLGLMRYLQPIKVSRGDATLDVVGACLCTLGLGASVFALIEQPNYGWMDPIIALPLLFGIICIVLFLIYERGKKDPMLPLSLFSIRNFSYGNIATTAIYAGLSVATFLVVIFLQQVGHYSALNAGLALLPVTILMFILSPRFGALAGKYGPRFFMAVGPLVGSAGFLLLTRVNHSITYWTHVFPGIVVFGLGLSMTVAPLTAAVLGSIDSKQAGIGSAINNMVARIAGLIAIASIGVIVGSHLTLSGFQKGILATAILLAIGGVISAIGIENPKHVAQGTNET